MADLFILAVLGHLVGDYLLQSKHMALTKSAPGWAGVRACTLHVGIYTAAVCAFLTSADPRVIALVFIPHWLIDRWSLASWWLKLIRGRTFEDALAARGPYREFDIAFTAIVYTVSDNTLHLLCLWAVVRWLA